MKKSYYIFQLISILILILFSISCSESPEHSDATFNMNEIGSQTNNKSEKKQQPLESYYQLDPIKFFARPENNKKLNVNLSITLSYPRLDHNIEQQIIDRRELINEAIKVYISKKTYSEMNTAKKREKIRSELLKIIQGRYVKGVQNVYYRTFFLMQI